jgi:hypothetical protein
MCYWENVRERIKNGRNTLRTYGTCCEPSGNMTGTQWLQQKSKKGDQCTSKGGICQF